MSVHAPSHGWALKSLKRVLRYVSGTLSCGLLIKKAQPSILTAFVDADWAGCPDDRRPTGGYLIYFGNNLTSWHSRKQPTVARSSTESEFKAVTNACVELHQLRTLLFELGVPLAKSPQVWCDNVGAVYVSTNPVFQAHTHAPCGG